MGQKIKPYSYRLGVIEDWKAKWYARKSFKDQLEEDVLIRELIDEKIGQAGVIRVEIERHANNNYRINIKAARPGLIIGRGGKGIEQLSRDTDAALNKLMRERGVKKPAFSVNLNIEELRRSEISAAHIAQNIAHDLEKRLPARRTMKKYLDLIMSGKEVKGGKIRFSGRIDGNEIARREWLAKGSLPLQTLRARIDYGEATAFCSYGTVGIKVWIYKGLVFENSDTK
mgnify:CR=1 FL=1